MKNVSVVTVVYNEEKRIESLLQTMSWSDDLIIVDKSSTDNTRALALKYTENVITIPYTDAGDALKYAVEQVKNDWILMVTASDIIHPELVKKMRILISDEHFEYDIISIPFALYVFGIRNKRSPWSLKNKEWMFKKSVVQLNDQVHNELGFTSKKVYVMEPNELENLSHLTHENMDSFLERHTRYTKIEAKEQVNEKLAFKKSIRALLSSIYYVVVKKKTFLLGWDGIALGLAYISYFIFKYLFIWEKFRGNGSAVYTSLRERIIAEWQEELKKSEK